MNKKGYTILEVTLFMAISAILALAAFAGLGPRLRNVRFTDSVRSLESSINAQFSDAQVGSNSRGSINCTEDTYTVRVSTAAGGASAGSAQGCVVNGLVAVFDNNSNEIKYRKVVSKRIPTSENCLTDINNATLFNKLRNCYKSAILPNASEEPEIYKYSNGLAQKTPQVGFGYAQDPNGSDKTIFSYVVYTSDANNYGVGFTNGLTTFRFDPAHSFSQCFNLGERDSTFTFTNSSLKPKIENDSGCST